MKGVMKTARTGTYRAPCVSRMVRYGLLLGSLPVLAACKKPKADAKPDVQSEQATDASASPEPISLEINGYNYTDLYIYSFEVNGQGGGNIFVSSPTSGGGGSVCCATWLRGLTQPVPVKIKWTRDRKRWCEKEVLISDPVPANPQHLAVHFFPDGHIDVELTENFPKMKLRLESVSAVERKKSGNTVADEQVARCQDGYPY